MKPSLLKTERRLPKGGTSRLSLGGGSLSPDGDDSNAAEVQVNHVWLPRKSKINHDRPVSKLSGSTISLDRSSPYTATGTNTVTKRSTSKLPAIVEDKLRYGSKFNMQVKNKFMLKNSQRILDKSQAAAAASDVAGRYKSGAFDVVSRKSHRASRSLSRRKDGLS